MRNIVTIRVRVRVRVLEIDPISKIFVRNRTIKNFPKNDKSPYRSRYRFSPSG